MSPISVNSMHHMRGEGEGIEDLLQVKGEGKLAVQVMHKTDGDWNMSLMAII